jgi:hypothetical protein
MKHENICTAGLKIVRLATLLLVGLCGNKLTVAMLAIVPGHTIHMFTDLLAN